MNPLAGSLSTGHSLVIASDECRHLLGDAAVGRVSWLSSEGLVSLPVAYGVHHDGRIGFLTGETGLLSELMRPTEVAFQVDDLDGETLTGWSVLVNGTAQEWQGEFPQGLCRPWAPGRRTLAVELNPHRLSGRSVSAD